METSVTERRRDGAIKGWSVFATRAIDKGEVVGASPPFLVHQTLANRKEVLVCAACHQFLGTEAMQLAMLDGLSCGSPQKHRNPRTNHTTTTTTTENNSNGGGRKRRWAAEDSVGDCGGHDNSRAMSAVTLLPSSPSPPSPSLVQRRQRSRRLAVAFARPCELPRLPRVPPTSRGEEADNCAGGDHSEDGDGGGNNCTHSNGNAGDAAGGKRGCGTIWRCEGGAPCEDLYCSPECREAAIAAGHGLICAGGSEDGSPIYEFRRYAEQTNETYLIAAAAVAAALSAPQGTRPFEALDGWEDPVSSGEEGSIASAKAEEVEEAWSMLSAALAHAHRNESSRNGNDDNSNKKDNVTGEGGRAACHSDDVRGMAGGVAQTPMGPIENGHCGVSSNSSSGSNSDGSSALTLSFFVRTVRALERHLAPITVPSPLISYCSRLAQTPADIKKSALPCLSAAISRAGLCAGAGGEEEEAAAAAAAAVVGPATTTATAIATTERTFRGTSAKHDIWQPVASERALCRLVQAASTSAAGGTVGSDAPFPPLSVVGLLPASCCPDHSCVPNAQLEAFLLPPVENDGRGEQQGGKRTTALRVGLVALRSIRKRGELFAPYVAVGLPVEQRRHELSSRLSFACCCPRCRLEADRDQECGSEMLKTLADQALEEGRHKTALALYKASLRSETASPSLVSRASASPACSAHTASPASSSAKQDERIQVKGDALHGVGVALLTAGRFGQACQAWKRGLTQAPTHPALQAQAEKEKAYRPPPVDENGNGDGEVSLSGALVSAGGGNCDASEAATASTMVTYDRNSGSNGSSDQGGGYGEHKCSGRQKHGTNSGVYACDSFTSMAGGAADIFMSKTPVLTSQECQYVIKAAEDYAEANEGWTTSRHYAVPTTDIPVHVLTPLLPWFRSLLRDRLFPTLAEHFNLGSCGGEGVYVHDAFVVRYEEGKQRHLPLHRDQSTHSFTIALNGLDEYRGGGTFFPSLGRALRPAKGHALSFRGSILHGGDPIIEGVRYIIACFCYADSEDVDESDIADTKNNVVAGVADRGTGEEEGGIVEAKTAVENGGNVSREEKRATKGNKKKGVVDFGADRAFSFGFSM